MSAPRVKVEASPVPAIVAALAVSWFTIQMVDLAMAVLK